MSSYNYLKDIDVVILCGGFGKRLQSVVSDRPKPMVEIGNQPFLDILLDYLTSYQLKRFIFCIGYKGDIIKKYYQNKRSSLEILFSEEKEPLGTAGAVKNAESFLQSSPFLVMNGDSFCQLEIDKFVNFHNREKSLVTLALTKAKDTKDYGLVNINSSGRIINFAEKSKINNKFVSAGVYLFQRDILSLIPLNKSCSLEYNLFPMITKKRFYGYVTDGNFIDIGTPERLEKAKQILSKFKL